jgi:hypothetical protein
MIVASEAMIFDCCACRSFAAALAGEGPYSSVDDVIRASKHIWWNEASHPRIS